jgi:hypothetical protein
MRLAEHRLMQPLDKLGDRSILRGLPQIFAHNSR